MHGSDDLSSQIELLSKYKQIKNLICVSDPSLDKPYGQQIASIVKALVEKNQYKQVVSSTSAFGKDVIPRLGGLLDVQPITDVIEIKSTEQFVRPIYAGNAICTVTSSDALKLVTVRCTSFEKSPEEDAQSIAQQKFDSELQAQKGKVLANLVNESESVDLTSAKYVVSGGRGMKNGENFGLLNDLAKKLGHSQCAVGASRAAVDAGYVPNDMQIGQTGKVVAPDLYIAVGISGAIQHVAGMKDAKVIVAINKDPDAPIFKISNYGLVDDLFKVMPELTEKIASE